MILTAAAEEKRLDAMKLILRLFCPLRFLRNPTLDINTRPILEHTLSLNQCVVLPASFSLAKDKNQILQIHWQLFRTWDTKIYNMQISRFLKSNMLLCHN